MRIVKVEHIEAGAYKIPTDGPEADGTLSWQSTELVVVQAQGAGESGLGYSYCHASAAKLIESLLAEVVQGRDAMNVAGATEAMIRAIRNEGRRGIGAMAISAVDTALWDLKARLLGLSLCRLLGSVREQIPLYGSGGFTSYSAERLQAQLADWSRQGFGQVKMKVGSHPADDPERVRLAREAIGPDTKLFVDANGAYSRKQALALAETFAAEDVSWFEEPVSSDDLEGLRLMRDRGPVGMDIAAGEYGYDPYYFRHMLQAGAVDVLQVDGTRCGGVSGALQAGLLCQSYGIPLSAHCAPSLHAHICCALPMARHVEYFHDHVRIEHQLFEGALDPVNGCLKPDLDRPGLGLRLNEGEARRFAV